MNIYTISLLSYYTHMEKNQNHILVHKKALIHKTLTGILVRGVGHL
jgi:hypothetical protein